MTNALFNLVSPIVALKYVFTQRSAEKLLSAVAEVAGTASSNLVSRHTVLDQEVAVLHTYSSVNSLPPKL